MYGHPQQSSAIQALSAGRTRYFTGVPCNNGHISERYASTRACIDCKIDYENKAYKASPTKYRARALARSRRSAGLPLPTRPSPGLCECCGKPPFRDSLNLDHNHKTGAFRGWLCGLCNTAIGKLGDNIDGLHRAINYLKKAEAT